MSNPSSPRRAASSRSNRPLRDDADFIDSLTSRQRAYFHRREAERQTRLQDALRDLSRGLSSVNELNNQTVHGHRDSDCAAVGRLRAG